MGFLFWGWGNKNPKNPINNQQQETSPSSAISSKPSSNSVTYSPPFASTTAALKTAKTVENEKVSAEAEAEAGGENGAMEVPRATDVAVFEFGSADLFTLAGYCPVSDTLQPCRWEVVPVPDKNDGDAPQFRIAF